MASAGVNDVPSGNSELPDIEVQIVDDRASKSPTPNGNSDPPSYKSLVPTRYQKHVTEDDPERETAREERRAKARETRRTRRTVRLQQAEQQEEKPQVKLQPRNSETHLKLEVSSESDASSVDENYDVASLAESIDEELTWRGRMQSVLHNHWLHLVIIILVALDAFIVIFELLLDIGAFENRPCSGEGIIGQAQNCHYQMPAVCPPHARMILESINISMATHVGADSELCRCGFSEGRYICLLPGMMSGVNPAVVLHVFSILILTLFLFEILLKMVAFRLKYFTHKFEVFDGMIVCISWTLDIASIVQEEAFEAAALLIVLRLWRVIRIVNGAVLTSKTQSDTQLGKAKRAAKMVVHALHKAQDKMDEFEDENTHLKSEIGILKAAASGGGKYKKMRSNSDESGDDDTRL